MTEKDYDITLTLGFDQSAVDESIDNMLRDLQKLEKEQKKVAQERQELIARSDDLQNQVNMDKAANAPPDEKKLNELAEIGARMEQLEAREAELQARAARVNAALESARTNPEQYAKTHGLVEDLEISTYKTEIAQAKINVQLAKSHILQAKTAEEAAKYRKELEMAEAELKNLQAPGAGKPEGDSSNKAQSVLATFGKRLGRLAASALVFSVIAKGLRSVVTLAGQYINANTEMRESLRHTKENLLIAFQPLWERIQPALTQVLRTVETISYGIAAAMAEVFGTTYDEARKATEQTYKLAKAQGQLLSFDTIQTIGAPNSNPFEGGNKTAIDYDAEGEKAKGIVSKVLEYIRVSWRVCVDTLTNLVWSRFENVWDYIENMFMHGKALISNLATLFRAIFSGDISTALKALGNVGIAILNIAIISANYIIRCFLSLVEFMINRLGGVVKIVGNLFGQDWGWSVSFADKIKIPTHDYIQLPALAKGAVIPPNAPFAAIVATNATEQTLKHRSTRLLRRSDRSWARAAETRQLF